MSFENPNPQERIDDSAKAEEMARESDYIRSQAAKKREKLDESYTPELKQEFSRTAEILDRRAEQLEQTAAIDYDIEKIAQRMDDQELRAAADKVFVDKTAAHEEMVSLRVAAASVSESESAVLEGNAKKAETTYNRLSRESFAFDRIIAIRRRNEKNEQK